MEDLMTHLKIALMLTTLLAQSAFAVCENWTSKKSGTLDRKIISEASGLTASRLKKDKLIWSNDSGGRAELYATGVEGKIERTVALSGFSNSDYEAVASGPCSTNKAESCLYVGDIGDGIGWRSKFKVGIFKENDFWTSTSIRPEKVIEYSKGPSNSEAMVVTNDGKMIIFSKDSSGITEVFELTQAGKISSLGEVNLNNIMDGVRGKGPRVTDASLSSDGKKVLLLTYGDIAEISTELILKPGRGQWRKGVDYNVVKGPDFPQQETITYLTDSSFIVSTESPDGEAPEVRLYSCAKR
jgi:hypothetical protein